MMPLLTVDAKDSPERDDTVVRFERDVLPLIDHVYRAARRYTQSHADAEDLVQDTMIRAYKGFSGFEDGTNVRAWIFKILHTTWINNFRKASRRPVEWLSADLSDPIATQGVRPSTTRAASAEVEALEAVSDFEVREALQALPESQRLVVYFVDVEGFKYREIAEILSVPLGTVMSRIHRGRRTLRELLMDYAKKHGYTSDDAALAA